MNSTQLKKNLLFTSPECSISNNIAVVGNSSSILIKEYGSNIDSFIDVVRFNTSPIKGYEKHVGSKTTIRVCNPKFFSAVVTNNPYWDTSIKERNSKVICIGPEDVGRSYEYGKRKIHSSCTHHKIDISRAYYGFRKQPSVGMGFVNILVSMGIVPTVYGFCGIPDGVGDQKLEHYWADGDIASICHDTIEERRIFKKWHEEERINWIDYGS